MHNTKHRPDKYNCKPTREADDASWGNEYVECVGLLTFVFPTVLTTRWIYRFLIHRFRSRFSWLRVYFVHELPQIQRTHLRGPGHIASPSMVLPSHSRFATIRLHFSGLASIASNSEKSPLYDKDAVTGVVLLILCCRRRCGWLNLIIAAKQMRPV